MECALPPATVLCVVSLVFCLLWIADFLACARPPCFPLFWVLIFSVSGCLFDWFCLFFVFVFVFVSLASCFSLAGRSCVPGVVLFSFFIQFDLFLFLVLL